MLECMLMVLRVVEENKTPPYPIPSHPLQTSPPSTRSSLLHIKKKKKTIGTISLGGNRTCDQRDVTTQFPAALPLSYEAVARNV